MSPDGPVLETQRLLLRPPRREDFDGWVEFAGDEETMRHLGGHVPRSVAWRYLLANAGAWSIQGFSMFAVIEKASGRWVGRVGPNFPEGWPGTEIGWGILHSRWGRGYAGEAAAAATDWAFAELGWTEVIHVIDPANTASLAVARKLGSRSRGPGQLPAPHENAVVDIYGQTREEWRLRARPENA
jgi:RimJ/RimL family protein N-acetyltransferase